MPRYSRIRVEALEDLARQLRFASTLAVVRQVERVLALSREIDPSRAYEEAWVLRRITGTRMERPGSEGSQLVGEAVLGDLSALAERLTSAARIGRTDLRFEVLGLTDLQKRWSVSRKTIERYRRRGLVGVRLAAADGAIDIVFPRASVEAFELAHRDLIAQAPLRRGREGRTTRPTVESHKLETEERLDVFTAWRQGEDPTELARRYGRTRASIHRIIRERRAELLRRLDLAGPDHEAFLAPEADGRFLRSPVVLAGLGEPPVLELDLYVEQARASIAADEQTERSRAEAFHYLRFGARRLIDRLRRFDPRSAELDEIETRLRWIALIKIELMRSQEGLVLRSIEERCAAPFTNLGSSSAIAAHRAAMEAVSASVDRFDPFRGGRLAGTAALALGRALAGVHAEAHGDRARDSHPILLEDWSLTVAAWQAWLDPDSRMREVVRAGQLGDEAAAALASRYGWSGPRPRTIAELAHLHGWSERQVALWEHKARRLSHSGSAG